MKKKENKLTKLLKLGILFFGISILLWNCEKEELIPAEEQQSLLQEQISKSISFETLENTDVYKHFNKKLQLDLKTDKKLNYFLKGTESANDITIITQKVNQVIKNGAETYSMLIEYGKEEEDTYYNLILHKKSNEYRIYTLKIEQLKKMHGKGTSASEEIEISVKPGIIPYDGWEDGDYGNDSSSGGDYEYQCRDIIVKVDILCTRGGHKESDSSCKCQVTDFNCYKGYTTLKTKEFCEYVWIGNDDDPNNTGNTGTGNTGNGGGTNTGLDSIETDVVNPKYLLPEGALQTIIDCVKDLTSEQIDWLNNSNNSSNVVSIWNFINENTCDNDAKDVITKSIEEDITSNEEFEEIFKRKKGCGKLKNLVTDNPNTNIKNHLQNLQPMISQTGEHGSEFTLDNSNNYNASSVPSSSDNNLAFNLRPELYAIAHTHPLSGFPMFSFKDVFLLYGIHRKARSDLKNKALVFMISKETTTSIPQTYAITINNINTFYNKLIAELNKITNDDPDATITLTMDQKVKALVKSYEDQEHISTNRELTFLDFFNDYDISLFKANDTNISGWSQLVTNSNSTSITTKPCN